MGLIQLLDDALINKIAAGEVVERPASVVKELIENSLDAGASRVTVELTEGGRKRILISDNGSGMDDRDAVLSLTRHATSKIKKDDDLFNLHTMGFRGEALASIAAVSKFTLMTCKQGEDLGVRVHVEGGGHADVTPWQSQGGTTIIVDDLFFNVPVRGKFLKTASTEYGAVLELMQSLALAWPGVDFTLVHNGKEQLRAPAIANLEGESLSKELRGEAAIRKRFVQIFKTEAATPMIFAEGESAYGKLQALVSAPGVEKGTSRDIYLFVNGRLIKDKTLRYAVIRGYHSHLLRGKFPIVVAFLTMDPALVDVNVHPSKTEVRLQFGSELQGMMAMSIREAIRKAEWTRIDPPQDMDVSRHQPTPAIVQSKMSTSSVFAPSTSIPSTNRGDPLGGLFSNRGFANQSKLSHLDMSQPVLQGGSTRSLFSDDIQPIPLAEDVIPWHELTWLGSIADCYLLFSHGERREGSKLLVIDQHAFHERILYERLCNNAATLKSRQMLLIPEVYTLRPDEIASLKEHQQVMETHGFTLVFVNDVTIELRSVPTILAKADPEAILLAFARREESAVPLNGNDGLAHDILATMACHGAVRAGEPLGGNELNALIREASNVDFFHNCPHGRRVLRWWSQEQIGRWFDR